MPRHAPGARKKRRTKRFAAVRAELRRLHELGLNVQAIARELGSCRRSVVGWLALLRLPRPRPHCADPAAREAEIRRLAAAGLKRSAIARRVGVSGGYLDALLWRWRVRTGPARYVPRAKYEEEER